MVWLVSREESATSRDPVERGWARTLVSEKEPFGRHVQVVPKRVNTHSQWDVLWPFAVVYLKHIRPHGRIQILNTLSRSSKCLHSADDWPYPLTVLPRYDITPARIFPSRVVGPSRVGFKRCFVGYGSGAHNAPLPLHHSSCLLVNRPAPYTRMALSSCPAQLLVTRRRAEGLDRPFHIFHCKKPLSAPRSDGRLVYCFKFRGLAAEPII